LGFSYSAFGLAIHSNLPLPGLPAGVFLEVPPTVPAEPRKSPLRPVPDAPPLSPFRDLAIHLAIHPPAPIAIPSSPEELIYTSAFLDETGEAVLRIWRAYDESFLRLAYCDGTQFWFDRSRQNVWATWPASLTLENTLSYLIGPVFGLLLRLRGIICLHASAVAFEDWCVVFVGSEGAGKSTTAAAFAKRGYPVLSDDIVALATPATDSCHATADHVFRVLPAYPHLCLWADSAQMIHGSAEELPRLSPQWDKRRMALGTHGTHFESRALPLGAIYIFADRGPDPAPSVAPAPAKASLLSLLANTYANNLLNRDMRAAEFAVLDRLVATVPVRLLTPHRDLAKLDQLCALVQQDFQRLARPGISPRYSPPHSSP
jgi:hypothetical protein